LNSVEELANIQRGKWSLWGEVMRRSHSPARQHRWISQLLLVAITGIAACSFSVVAIDRPVAEFIDANVKSEWLYTARTLAAVSIRVHFFFCWALSIITLLLEKAG